MKIQLTESLGYGFRGVHESRLTSNGQRGLQPITVHEIDFRPRKVVCRAGFKAGNKKRFSIESPDHWCGMKLRKVLDCGSPLPLSVRRPAVEKWQRAAVVQDTDAWFIVTRAAQ